MGSSGSKQLGSGTYPIYGLCRERVWGVLMCMVAVVWIEETRSKLTASNNTDLTKSNHILM